MNWVTITSVDPVAHDLLFERFLSPARSSPPDIDLDFCSRRRDKVLEYVRRTYGAEQVALVATVSTLRPKSAIRETAKAYGLDEAAIKRLVSLLPRPTPGGAPAARWRRSWPRSATPGNRRSFARPTACWASRTT